MKSESEILSLGEWNRACASARGLAAPGGWGKDGSPQTAPRRPRARLSKSRGRRPPSSLAAFIALTCGGAAWRKWMSHAKKTTNKGIVPRPPTGKPPASRIASGSPSHAAKCVHPRPCATKKVHRQRVAAVRILSLRFKDDDAWSLRTRCSLGAKTYLSGNTRVYTSAATLYRSMRPIHVVRIRTTESSVRKFEGFPFFGENSPQTALHLNNTRRNWPSTTSTFIRDSPYCSANSSTNLFSAEIMYIYIYIYMYAHNYPDSLANTIPTNINPLKSTMLVWTLTVACIYIYIYSIYIYIYILYIYIYIHILLSLLLLVVVVLWSSAARSQFGSRPGPEGLEPSSFRPPLVGRLAKPVPYYHNI